MSAASLSRDAAAELDARDPLRGFRERFVIDPEVVYLDGNSLGCLPHGRRSSASTRSWRSAGASAASRAWDDGWLDLPIEVGDRLGAAVLGAAPGQVAIGDSTTVCFYKLVSAALDARAGPHPDRHRPRQLPDRPLRARGDGAVARPGDRVAARGSDGGPEPDAVAARSGPDTALVTFSHVSYRSAHIADMAEVNAVVDGAGALMLWDLSHSAGSVPALARWRPRPARGRAAPINI